VPPGVGQFRQALFEQAPGMIPFHNFIPVSCARCQWSSFDPRRTTKSSCCQPMRSRIRVRNRNTSRKPSLSDTTNRSISRFGRIVCRDRRDRFPQPGLIAGLLRQLLCFIRASLMAVISQNLTAVNSSNQSKSRKLKAENRNQPSQNQKFRSSPVK